MILVSEAGCQELSASSACRILLLETSTTSAGPAAASRVARPASSSRATNAVPQRMQFPQQSLRSRDNIFVGAAATQRGGLCPDGVTIGAQSRTAPIEAVRGGNAMFWGPAQPASVR